MRAVVCANAAAMSAQWSAIAEEELDMVLEDEAEEEEEEGKEP